MRLMLVSYCLVAVVALAGCSSSGGSGFFSTATTEPPKPFFNDPDTRTTQVAWNSVRAQKCGFQIDVAKLKANYLAWEAQLGTDPTIIAKLDGDYEKSRQLVAARVGPKPVAEYCTDAQVAETRGFIQRYMAGDFSATPVAKRVLDES